eukprot:11852975-Alexandrium_andersonii.AAC.1
MAGVARGWTAGLDGRMARWPKGRVAWQPGSLDGGLPGGSVAGEAKCRPGLFAQQHRWSTASQRSLGTCFKSQALPGGR